MFTIRRICLISYALMTMIMSSCTLVLETPPAEYNDTSDVWETQGFGEPFTVKNEFGDITFQYNDSTRVLMKAAFDYLIKNDRDSALYFSDNIPKELLVHPGHYIATSVCHEFPFGLCHKVVELNHQAGVYEMILEKAAEENVYDVLNMEMDFDFQTIQAPELPDSAQCVEKGYDPNNPVVVDYSYLDKAQTRSIHPAGSMLSPIRKNEQKDENEKGEKEATWIDLEKEGSDNYDKGDKTSKDYEIFSLRLSMFSAAEKMPEIKGLNKIFPPKVAKCLHTLASVGLDGGITLTYTSTKTIHTKVVLDKNPSKTERWQKVIDESKVSLTLDVKEAAGISNPDESYAKLEGKMKDLLDDERDQPNDGEFSFTYAVPISGPYVFFLRVWPHLGVEVAVIGSAKASLNVSRTVTEKHFIGDEEVEDTPKPVAPDKSKTTFEWEGFDVCGKFGISGGLEAVVGLGVGRPGFNSNGGAKMTGLALGVDIGFDLSITASYAEILKGNPKNALVASFKCPFKVVGRMFLGGKTWPFGLFATNLIEINKYGIPSLGRRSAPSVKWNNLPGGEKDLTISCGESFNNLGIMGGMNPAAFTPIMKMEYTDDLGVKHKHMMEFPKDYEFTKIKKDELYKFEYTIYDFKGAYDLTLTPGVRFRTYEAFFDDQYIKPSLYDKPMLQQDHVYFSSYEEDIDAVGDAETGFDFFYLYKFGFTTRFFLTNGSKIPDNWDEWGVRVRIREDWGDGWFTAVDNEYFPINTKNLDGVVDVKFNYTSFFSKDETKLNLTVEGYYVEKGSDKKIPCDCPVSNRECEVRKWSDVEKLPSYSGSLKSMSVWAGQF